MAEEATQTEGETPKPAGEPQKPATPPEPKAEVKVFTQADVDHILKERLEREESKRAKATEKAKADAEEQALKDRQAFEELATKRQKRIEELEPLAGQLDQTKANLDAYQQVFAGYLKTEKNGLSEPILALLEKLDPIDQLKWISENKGKLPLRPLDRLGAQGAAHVPPTPAPNDGAKLSEAETENRRKQFGDQVRNFF